MRQKAIPDSNHVRSSLNDESRDLEALLTLREAADCLKVNEDTIRRLFINEPGVVVICFPRKGKRVYRTVRIPMDVFRRVVTRLTRVNREREYR
jgi:hypothetical protein